MWLQVIGSILFYFAAFIAACNFYLSFLHYPLYRLIGKEYHWNSGFPAIGTIALVLSVIAHHASPYILERAAIVALFDTGGLPWFAAIMFWRWLKGSQ